MEDSEKKSIGRPRKDGKYLNCYCDAKLVDKLDHYAVIQGVSKISIIERSLKMYFDHCEKRLDIKV